MIRVLFICHGNICRSPMAEFIMCHQVQLAGLEDHFQIASAATSAEELGNPVYPPARRMLSLHGLDCSGKTARQMTRADYAKWDYLICMDRANLRNMRRIAGGDPENKMRLLMSFTGSDADIKDPWYSGDFEGVYAQIDGACEALLKYLIKQNRIEHIN